MRILTTGITVLRRTLPPRRASASRAAAGLLAGVLALAGVASAGAWPEKPLRVVVAYPAGGMADVFTRTLQPRLSESLGQPLVIENRGGAGGTVAEALVAKSAPDGYTMMVGVSSIPANPHLFRNLKYDLFRDLIPVTMLARVPLVLLVHPSVPASSLADFIAYARTQRGKVAYASPGSGTSPHLYMEVLKAQTGVEMTHVPYKGGSPAVTDLVGGQVQALLISVTLAAPQVQANKVRALAVTSEKRTPMLPHVPSFSEAGYDDFTPHVWTGLFLPAGTPPAIVERLYSEHAKAGRSPEVQSRFRELGAEIVMNTPAEFSASLRAESVRLGKLIQERRIVAD